MNNPATLTLLNDGFTHEEARDILLNFYAAKINFYKIKNYCSQERYGKDDHDALSKIPFFKHEMEKALELVSQAKTSKKQLIISSEININLSIE